MDLASASASGSPQGESATLGERWPATATAFDVRGNCAKKRHGVIALCRNRAFCDGDQQFTTALTGTQDCNSGLFWVTCHRAKHVRELLEVSVHLLHDDAYTVDHRGTTVATARSELGDLLFHALDTLLLVLPFGEEPLCSPGQIFGRHAQGIGRRPKQSILLACVAKRCLSRHDGQPFDAVLNGR